MVVRQSAERQFAKSLTWIGQSANTPLLLWELPHVPIISYSNYLTIIMFLQSPIGALTPAPAKGTTVSAKYRLLYLVCP